jgi:hypothetical protein
MFEMLAPAAPFSSVLGTTLSVGNDTERVVRGTLLGATVEFEEDEGDTEPEVEDAFAEAARPTPPAAPASWAGIPPTKEPVPHGIFVPSLWVDLEGATAFPEPSVIMKRPVQVLLEDDGVENW